MMKLYTVIKISLLALLFLVDGAYAIRPKAMVQKVKGKVFASGKGHTRTLGPSDQIFEFDEIFTEIGAEVSFNDSYDHVFTLTGGSHVAVLNKMIELKRGYLWVQSTVKRQEEFTIQTVNSQTKYTDGEFVISYDQDSGRTQLLCMTGTVQFANLTDSELKEFVTDGRFSFISEHFNYGAPRMPTPVGPSTHAKILSLFDAPLQSAPEKVDKNEFQIPRQDALRRLPASAQSSAVHPEGRVGRMISGQQNMKSHADLQRMYQQKIRQLEKRKVASRGQWRPNYREHSNVKVRIFGQANSQRSPASDQARKSRKPASMRELNPQVEVKKDQFEGALLDQYKNQMRHSQEINSLINELKSYDMDYKQSY